MEMVNMLTITHLAMEGAPPGENGKSNNDPATHSNHHPDFTSEAPNQL
jgi:hypothetical protein